MADDAARADDEDDVHAVRDCCLALQSGASARIDSVMPSMHHCERLKTRTLNTGEDGAH